MGFYIYIFSYIVGSIPFGVLIGRLKGVDITAYGSGNIGATNVSRVLGKPLGFLVLGLDAIKGLIPALLGASFFNSQEQSLICGMLAVMGHLFSPFLKFKGGKGISTGFGMLIGSVPWIAVGVFLTFFTTFLMTRYISLSSIFATIFMLVMGIALKHTPIMLALYIGVAFFVLFRHRSNIKRLLKGEEPKYKARSIQETN